ncbi:trigger factor [Helicobacter felis]|uniref:trigger factor n=1 Tax=Helicobacter felis TaxID=214 RepID=UPI000CF04F13|nr:trigger factor [Helicobacter felis]
MVLETKKLDGANARVYAKSSLEDFQQRAQKIAKRIAQKTKIDGFRRGKVPIDIINQRYQAQIQEESQKELLDSVLKAGVEELKLAPHEMMGNPAIIKFEKQDQHFDIELNIGLRPQIDLSGIETCIPSFSVEAITPEQVEERLKQLAKEKSTFSDAPEHTKISEGQGVVLDFEGLLEGKPFEGNSAKDFALIVGEGRLLKDFEDQLIGMQVGEEKSFSVHFPKDYASVALADKEVVFRVKIHKIQNREIPAIDEEFVKTVLNQEKEPTLDMLKERLKDQLFMEAKIKLYNQELKDQLVENLEKALNFDLPHTVVEQEMDLVLRQSLQSMSKEEIEELQKDPSKVQEKRESLRERVLKSVKVTFIIDALARQEDIQVDDKEVFQTLYYEAMMTNQNPQKLIEHYEKNFMLPAVKMTLIEDRLLTFLLDRQLAKAQA